MNLTDSPHKLSFPQLLQWANRPSDFLDACAQRFGDIFAVQFSGSSQPVLFVSHAAALEQVLTAPPGTFASGEGSEKFRPIMGDYSLLVLDGKPHQRQRKLMMPPLHGERMRLYGTLICQLTEQMMESWRVGNSFNLFACMEEVTLDSLLSVVFGLKKGEGSDLHQKLLALVELATSPLIALHLFVPSLRKDLGRWSPWGRFLRFQQDVDHLLYSEIAHRHQHPQPDRADILTLLMAARDEEGKPMSDRELRDELVTLLLAGYDTVSTAMMWAMYWIHTTPNVRDRLVAELDTITDPTDTKAITKLPYLHATCQETLRLTPSIVLGSIRIAQAPFTLMGTELPEGSRIYPNIYAAHRRPETYTNPEQFRPDRFLERQFSPYEYFPFGGGTRGCIGSAFAQFQMKLALFTILSRYKLTLTDPRSVQPIRRGPGLVPSRTLYMQVTERRQPVVQPMPCTVQL